MNVLVWLDASLVVLGLLAVSPALWNWFCRRRQSVCPPSLGRGMRIGTAFLFYLGLGSLTAGGIDVGLAAWQDAHRPQGGTQPLDLGPRNYEDVPHVEAPDFRLPSLDEDRFIRLSDFRGHKPVVLIFGSFG